MTMHSNYAQGTSEWFEMVGTVLRNAMNRGRAPKLRD
jgi:hypothetical protein